MQGVGASHVSVSERLVPEAGVMGFRPLGLQA